MESLNRRHVAITTVEKQRSYQTTASTIDYMARQGLVFQVKRKKGTEHVGAEP